MSLIKPRTRGKHLVRHITHLDCENHETLYAYAVFIGEDTAYVLNELIDTVLGRDREFVKWRAVHAESCAPPVGRNGRRRTTARMRTSRPIAYTTPSDDLAATSPM